MDLSRFCLVPAGLSPVPIFLQFSLFLRKFMFGSPKDVNSFLDLGSATHDSEVTRLDATDLGSEVPGYAQQDILFDVDVAGTSEPWISAPSSEP